MLATEGLGTVRKSTPFLPKVGLGHVISIPGINTLPRRVTVIY